MVKMDQVKKRFPFSWRSFHPQVSSSNLHSLSSYMRSSNQRVDLFDSKKNPSYQVLSSRLLSSNRSRYLNSIHASARCFNIPTNNSISALTCVRKTEDRNILMQARGVCLCHGLVTVEKPTGPCSVPATLAFQKSGSHHGVVLGCASLGAY